jgi:hypothetical protein
MYEILMSQPCDRQIGHDGVMARVLDTQLINIKREFGAHPVWDELTIDGETLPNPFQETHTFIALGWLPIGQPFTNDRPIFQITFKPDDYPQTVYRFDPTNINSVGGTHCHAMFGRDMRHGYSNVTTGILDLYGRLGYEQLNGIYGTPIVR